MKTLENINSPQNRLYKNINEVFLTKIHFMHEFL